MAASKSTLRCFILNKRKLEWLLQSTNHRAKFSLSPCETKRIFLFLSLFLSFPSRRDNARRTESGGRGRRKYPRVTRTNGTGLSGNIKDTRNILEIRDNVLYVWNANDSCVMTLNVAASREKDGDVLYQVSQQRSIHNQII